MKQKISKISASVLIILILLITGCQQDYSDGKEDTNTNSEFHMEETQTPTNASSPDILEKRGYKTNITEFKQLLQRLSRINEYKYTFTDTEEGIENQKTFIKGRFVRIELNELKNYETGEAYDEILMDRITQQAFSHCGYESCPKPDADKEVEMVDFLKYKITDPFEYVSRMTNAQYIGEKMIGDQYTKVFKINYDGKSGRVWLQEYYGFPLRVELIKEDGTKRVIKFDDIMIDNTRQSEIEMPFDFTIKGQEKSWYFWEHYLGIWKPTIGTKTKSQPEIQTQV